MGHALQKKLTTGTLAGLIMPSVFRACQSYLIYKAKNTSKFPDIFQKFAKVFKGGYNLRDFAM